MESAAECDGDVSVLLGAYVLGGLSADEELTVRAHLTRCARCRAEHDDLASITSALGLLVGPEGSTGTGQDRASE